MKIFTRYMIIRFVGPFLYGLGAFALIVFLGDLFDKMNRIATSSAPAWMIMQYLALQIPYWTIRIVPMATLLATLFSVTSFIASGEFVAVQAAGLRPRDFFRPILWMSLVVGALSFAAQESLLPSCYERAQSLWQGHIHPEWEWNKYYDAVLAAGADRFITTDLFLVNEQTMNKPVMDYYYSGKLIRQLDARQARWDAQKSVWVFHDGVEREFGDGGAVTKEQHFAEFASDLDIPPKKLMPRGKDPEDMSIREIRQYLQRLILLGQPTRPALVALRAKISFPFANLVLCALGIPIALRLRRSSRAISFAAALVVSFLYLWVIEMGKALGNAGTLTPVLAAWLPNFLFGALAVGLYKRAEI